MEKKVVKNAAWIIICKIAQAVLSMVLTMFTARYMGPSNYGVVTYAAAVVAFAMPIMQLGLNCTLVQELVLHTDNEGEILGTAIMMSVLSALCCMAGIISFSMVANTGEKETTVVCGLYSVVLVFQAVDLVEYWFQYKYLSKYSAVVSFFAYVVVSAYKVFILLSKKNIYWFAVSNVLDYFIISLVLIVIYRKIGNEKLCLSFSVAKNMLASSKYYIFSGLMVTVFAQTDRIMLKIMVGDVQTGYYSAAVNCVGATSFIFAAAIDSMRPLILENKRKSKAQYENSVVLLYCMVIYPAVVTSLLLTLFSEQVVYFLYGKEYFATIKIMQILAWYTAFSYYGGAKDVWILSEGKQKYLVLLNASGALMNVVLNYVLILPLGACGAAIASLFTQIFTNVVMGFLIQPLRRNNILMLQSLNPRQAVVLIKYFVSLVIRKNVR